MKEEIRRLEEKIKELELKCKYEIAFTNDQFRRRMEEAEESFKKIYQLQEENRMLREELRNLKEEK